MSRAKTINIRQAKMRNARKKSKKMHSQWIRKFVALVSNPVFLNITAFLFCIYMGWKLFVVQDLYAVGVGSLGPAGATIAAALCSTAYAGFSVFLYFVAKGRTVFASLVTAIMMTMMFAATYEQLGLSGREDFSRFDYIYFSLVTLTTLGYGDLQPTLASQGVAVVNALFGYFFLAVIIAKLLTVIKIHSVLGDKTRP